MCVQQNFQSVPKCVLRHLYESWGIKTRKLVFQLLSIWACETFETPSDVNKSPTLHCFAAGGIICSQSHVVGWTSPFLKTNSWFSKTFPEGEKSCQIDLAIQVGEAASVVHVCSWPAGGETPDWLQTAPWCKAMHVWIVLFFRVIGSQESDQKLFPSNVKKKCSIFHKHCFIHMSLYIPLLIYPSSLCIYPFWNVQLNVLPRRLQQIFCLQTPLLWRGVVFFMRVIVFRFGDGAVAVVRRLANFLSHVKQPMSQEPLLPSGSQDMGDISIWLNNLPVNAPGLIISTVISYYIPGRYKIATTK